ncbi:sterol desaturase family protein [Solitalea longa]|uniref:Sterol desaturase family protein n=1 Tax=Solitalea longa TaxID=2079460 RepID=A0A2S5A256_9SPHI|nr:sterol desaturase family protein [Solitalea longa]POY36635.1 sterol desaturase family protein [Solitalea longa]
MQSLITDWKVMSLLIFFIALGRYLFLAGSAYLICYKLGIKLLHRYKIQPKSPAEKQIKNELLFSLSTISIFSLVGIIVYFLYRKERTTIYLDINEHGWVYFFCSLVIMILLHDIYFYLTHRLLHTRWLLRNVHSVHHRSVNPTPLAAYCFHPVEAILQSLIVFPFVTILPINLFAFLLFTFLVLLMNVMGHLGFEFMSQRFRSSKIGMFFTSSTHHNLHHQKVNENYGYYFTWCDQLFKTIHKDTFK